MKILVCTKIVYDEEQLKFSPSNGGGGIRYHNAIKNF